MPRPLPLDQALGDVLREIRLQKGMSQEQLALACDRHRTYVSLLERGKNSPSVRTLFMIAAALDVTPSSLLKRVEKRSSGYRGCQRSSPIAARPSR